MGERLNRFVAFWNKAYHLENPWDFIRDTDGEWPEGLKETLGDQAILPPEPYYGYFHEPERMKNDMLMLLINPRSVDQPKEHLAKWLPFNVKRYRDWTREDYWKECGVLDTLDVSIERYNDCPLHVLSEDGCKWRKDRYERARNSAKLDFTFLHTMEYSFFHSYQWSDLAPYHKWLRSLPTTKLALDALIDIARERLVKYIVAIGKDWTDILMSYDGVKLVNKAVLYTERGGYSHRFFQFSAGPDSIPIVTYISGAGTIQFPTDEKAVAILKSYLTSYKEIGGIDAAASESVKEEGASADCPKQNNGPTDPKKTARDVHDEITNRVQKELTHLKLSKNRKANSGKAFLYRHFYVKNEPVWHKDNCNVRLHVYYGNEEQITARVEFGFAQSGDFIAEEQKERLRKLMDDYARAHGLGIRNDSFYKMNEVITGDRDSVIPAASAQLVKMVEDMDDLLHTIM